MKTMTDVLAQMSADIHGVASICVIDGSSGLILAHFENEAAFNPEAMAAEMAHLVAILQEMAKKMGTGALERGMIETEAGKFILAPITGKVFVGIGTANTPAALGSARHTVQRYRETLKNMLS